MLDNLCYTVLSENEQNGLIGKKPNSHKYMLEWEFDVAIEGKNDQHVIKHKKIGWSLIYELWGKSVNM